MAHFSKCEWGHLALVWKWRTEYVPLDTPHREENWESLGMGPGGCFKTSGDVYGR